MSTWYRMSVWHRVQHWFGWQLGTVTHVERDGHVFVTFRCTQCGELDRLESHSMACSCPIGMAKMARYEYEYEREAARMEAQLAEQARQP